jgi:hypothetical protein
MKKVVCLGFMALVLGAQAQVNNPPLNVFATVTAVCAVQTACSYHVVGIQEGSQQTCAPGSQPSCSPTACVGSGPWAYVAC